MSPRMPLEGLLAELEELIDEVLGAARGCSQDPARWSYVVQRWTGGEPRHGRHPSGAGNGADVLAVLKIISERYVSELRTLEAHARATDDDELEDDVDRALHTVAQMPSSRVSKYNQALSQPESGVRGIFARAAARQTHSAAPAQKSRTMMFCRTCRAPREGASLYESCSYCGEPLFANAGD